MLVKANTAWVMTARGLKKHNKNWSSYSQTDNNTKTHNSTSQIPLSSQSVHNHEQQRKTTQEIKIRKLKKKKRTKLWLRNSTIFVCCWIERKQIHPPNESRTWHTCRDDPPTPPTTANQWSWSVLFVNISY